MKPGYINTYFFFTYVPSEVYNGVSYLQNYFFLFCVYRNTKVACIYTTKYFKYLPCSNADICSAYKKLIIMNTSEIVTIDVYISSTC